MFDFEHFDGKFGGESNVALTLTQSDAALLDDQHDHKITKTLPLLSSLK
jgi:hypothetical protein